MNNPCIGIIDFGSQYTQIIARRIREVQVYSRVYPHTVTLQQLLTDNVQGLILSGGPSSVYDHSALSFNPQIFDSDLPILGICYGMYLLVQHFGGKVEKGYAGEYGKAVLQIHTPNLIVEKVPNHSVVWMSHGDTVTSIPKGFHSIASTDNTVHALIIQNKRIGVQFHPEVSHSEYGKQILGNFVFGICKMRATWTTGVFLEQAVQSIQNVVGSEKVLCALSGGIDSAVTALVLHKAIGKQLHCIFVDTGLLRKNERELVIRAFQDQFMMDLEVVDAKEEFLARLEGIIDPEEKRKRIGHHFITLFEKEARASKARFLAQGTLYSDVIESTASHTGPIKTHHNVGGLPKTMHLQLIEPLRELFKDEVRLLGKELGLHHEVLTRHPFPGPGLAIRILGEVRKEWLDILREADNILIETLKKHALYGQIWQAFAVLLPVKSVGVMGDNRTYEQVIAIRCVESQDGMTATPYPLPHEVLTEVSHAIINQVQGVNRVVYDISAKPPATIEWE